MAVSRRFIAISSRLLMASMVPLTAGLCLDVYVVARLIVDTRGVAAIIAAALLCVFIVFWFVSPRLARLSHVGTRSAD